MTKSKFSIEEAFDELNKIIMQMEDPGIGLADSMSLYKKGVKLLDKCSQTLNKTEKEIKILQEGKYGAGYEGESYGENQED